MISPFLAPRSLPSFLSEYTGLVATTGLPGNTPSHIPSPWSGSSDLFHRPARSVAACFLRLQPFRGRYPSAKISAGSFLSLGAVLSSCRRLLSYRASSAVWVSLFFRYGAFYLPYYFLHLFRFAGMPLPPPIVCIRLEIWKEVVLSFVTFLMLFPAVSISVHALRYKRYTFFRPGFEGFLPSPPRLAAILFESPTRLQPSRFQRPHFPLLQVYKYAACIFCNTLFQIPCWQVVHVHINIIMAGLSYSSPPFSTKIHCKRENFFSWTWFWPNVFIAKFPLEALENFPYNSIH